MQEAGVEDYDGSIVVGTARGVVDGGDIGAGAEAVEQGVSDMVGGKCIVEMNEAGAALVADERIGLFFDLHSGRVLDGEGLFVAATVAFNGKGVGASVGGEVKEDGVAFDAVPEVAGRVGDGGKRNGNGSAVVATGTCGGLDDEGVEQGDEFNVEGVGFGASAKGRYLQDVRATLGDVGIGDAAVGDLTFNPLV